MPAGLENPGLDGSHPPANTPGGMSDGGPSPNYSERAHSPSAILRQEEEEEEVMVLLHAYNMCLALKFVLCTWFSVYAGVRF